MAESNEPKEWKEGQAAARRAREVVAEQFRAELLGHDMTGGHLGVIHRLSEVKAALREGDHAVLRAAVFELTIAGGAWTASLDLKQDWPPRPAG